MDGRLLPFEHLEVIDDPTPRAGALNMAIDEILLTRLRGSPVLRVYRWTEPSVSLGYFGLFNEAKRLAQGRKIVRRWTGGGIVEHGEDLTYSLIVPRSSEFAKLRGTESYRVIHDAIALALDGIGCHTEAHIGAPDGYPAVPDNHACFEKPVPHDLLADGRKVAGAAQRHTRDGLLHQGSVRFAACEGGSHRDLPSKLGDALPLAFGLNRTSRALSEDELAVAVELATAKYAANRWLEKF